METFFGEYKKMQILNACKQALLTLCLLGVLIGACEFLLQLKLRVGKTDDLLVTLPNGFRLMRPNVDTVLLGGANSPVHVKTNNEGFASPEYSIVTPTNTKRIAFLGNSFTKGFEVDYDKKFTSLIEQKLQEDARTNSGYNYEVMNFAQGGTSVAEQLLIYETYVQKYHPDAVVLVMYAGYDFSAHLPFLDREEYLLQTPAPALDPARLLHPPEAKPSTDSPQNFKQFLVARSEVVRFLIRFMVQQTAIHRIAVDLGILHQPFSKDVGDYLTEVWSYLDADAEKPKEVMQFTAALVKKLGEDVEENSSKFFVVFIPSHWQVDNRYISQLESKNPDVHYNFLLPNQIISSAISPHFPMLDLSEHIERAINQDHQQIFVNDVSHFTRYGHQLAADEIYRFIRAQGL